MRRLCWLVFLLTAAGCGTTRWSDTSRTGTEQLLLSTAIDRAINNIDFTPLAGKEVYFDPQYLSGSVDENYVVSSLRQHLLANGCVLKDDREEAAYVVEARSGGIGTNRHDVLFGVPQTNIPSVGPLAGVPSAIPELPFAKSTDQKGIAKLAVYAYNRATGLAVWQSGAFPVIATAKDTWVLGMGPFQRGTIYDGTRFAGSRLAFTDDNEQELNKPDIPITAEAIFPERPVVARAPASTDSAAMDAAGTNSASIPNPPAVAETPPAASTPPPVPPDASPLPAGRIVRLPPLEEAARPDLRTAQAPRAREETGGGSASAQDHANGPDEGFNLFRPGSWFQ